MTKEKRKTLIYSLYYLIQFKIEILTQFARSLPSPPSIQDLRRFLLDQKKNGYSIIGMEQTSSSVQLSNFSFPEKVVLLLGDEKKGVPVELLDVIDYCVEIPQFGVTRSLNVHVCGSLAIWEYTRQRNPGCLSTILPTK